MRSLALLLLLLPQDKKDPPKSPTPKVSYAQPFVLVPGQAVKLTVRGLNLDQATEAKIEGAEVSIKSKGRAEIPKDSEPAVHGDTKLELEVKLSEGAEKAELVVVNPAGTTGPYAFSVVAKDRLVAEKEPNGGFAQAQPVEEGKSVQGAVGSPNDVDVFRVIGKAGETWVFDAVAQRRGSPLDPILTLHDPAGRIAAVSDDSGDSRDATIRLKLPADGAWSLSLVDAHNQGGATHVYLLSARREGP
jgi:hypothetical protein